jgi:hypothetical protein
MNYKLAFRDNIDSDRFESWPAVLDKSFTRFNNSISDIIFNTEDAVLNWLESKTRSKSSNRNTNIQEFRNGDPNKLYSIYMCDHADVHHGPEIHDKFIYSLRIKRGNESFSTFVNEKGIRLNSSFKKIDKKHEYDTYVSIDDIMNYSAEPRIINKSFYEGIFPLEQNDSDPLHKRYMEYAKSINSMDTDENRAKSYPVVYMENTHGTRWLDLFVKKLEHVEKYLEFFSKGGNILMNINKDPNHDVMLRYIFQLLDDNRQNTPEDDDAQLTIRNMMIDPYLASLEIFQVRYNKSLITWHRNYIYLIRRYNIVPSKQFADMILNFNLMDFYKQNHNRDNLLAMIKNLEEIYGIDNARNVEQTITFIKNRVSKDQNKERFHTVVRAFNN